MQKKSLLIFSALVVFVLGAGLIYVGVSGDKTVIAPVLSGIAFIVIATVFMSLGRANK